MRERKKRLNNLTIEGGERKRRGQGKRWKTTQLIRIRLSKKRTKKDKEK
jgi:hypothetical protein